MQIPLVHFPEWQADMPEVHMCQVHGTRALYAKRSRGGVVLLTVETPNRAAFEPDPESTKPSRAEGRRVAV
jgi:hypothetical protein